MNLKKIKEGIKKIVIGRKRVVVIVQCRLSSTRLPRKALLPLGGKTILEWTLASMKKVEASKYFLAVDEESREELEPIAKKCGWDFYAGSQSDVLDRFCNVIKISKADVVLRATADNPFLFYEAAQKLVDEYFLKEKNSPVDYITFSGLPHGSGVEVFNADSLLEAALETDLPYDHEHVGPALYNHSEKYICAFVKAPQEFYYPDYRTTVDTLSDYKRALRIVKKVSNNKIPSEPYSTNEILSALSFPAVKNPVLLIPSVKKGHGTGHLRRCLDLAIANSWDVYIPNDADLTQRLDLIGDAQKNGLDAFQIVNEILDLSIYCLAITDLFLADNNFIRSIAAKIPVASLDEGNCDNDYAEYLFDIIPSLKSNRNVNYYNPAFIPL
ncbi:MAG TPA: acylneuraminate cytidylyltransferase, partial [Treponema sp.]|nr:acylneuraminate cytidylyltransferase [Treponema sp.]